jgi:hypothetical protein
MILNHIFQNQLIKNDPRRNISGMVEYRPLELGARLMAGRLSLEQLVVVRIHCPQPE